MAVRGVDFDIVGFSFILSKEETEQRLINNEAGRRSLITAVNDIVDTCERQESRIDWSTLQVRTTTKDHPFLQATKVSITVDAYKGEDSV